MIVEMEVSLYPVGDVDLSHPANDFAHVLEAEGCAVTVGPMSSFVVGDSSQIFAALRKGYESAAQQGGCVLIVKACNVCPL